VVNGKPAADDVKITPASVILLELHERAPGDNFTLNWLMGSLQEYSFGLIMLLLAFGAAAPGICMVAGLLLMIPAIQMAIGRPSPAFPNWISARPLQTKHLRAVVERAVPILKHVEKVVRPRWPTPPQTTKRIVGVCIALLCVRLVLAPLPLSNVLPAIVIALISLAYLEEDGLVLSAALLAGFVMLGFDASLVWHFAQNAQIKLPF